MESIAEQVAGANACSSFHAAIELIGRRWNGVILNRLLDGPLRFSQLRAAIPEVTDAMLTLRLKELEAAALLVRSVSTDRPIEVHYALTEVGAQLSPILAAIGRWSVTWDQAVAVEGRADEC
jgi:DNA-binding HxlR family transcriptional regulator